MEVAETPLVLAVDARALASEARVVVLSWQKLSEEAGDVEADIAALRDPRNVLTYCGCGRPNYGMDVRLVDPETLTEAAEGSSGEVWVTGDSVARGYFNLPELTKQSFYASFRTRQGKQSDDVYLRTGDTGFFFQEQLFIAGRLKDLIIIRGRNYYPQDIEESLETIQDLRPSNIAVFALNDDDAEEEVAVAAELRMEQEGLISGLLSRFRTNAAQNERCEVIAKEIQKKIATQFGLPVRRVWLLRPKSIPKTSSGKIRRNPTKEMLSNASNKSDILYVYDCQERILAAMSPKSEIDKDSSLKVEPDLRPFPSPPPGPEESVAEQVTREVIIDGERFVAPGLPGFDFSVHEQLVEQVKAVMVTCCNSVLGFPELPDLDAPLYELGVDSMAAVEFSDVLGKELNLEVEATLLFNYPTLNDIIDFLARELGSREMDSFLPPPVLASSPRNGESALAIIGAACQLPGGCSSADLLWSLLCRAEDAIVEVPPSRWAVEEYYNSDPDAEGKMYVREGGFVSDAEYFDAAAFRISPSEAHSMDPQQRGFLETAHEAFIEAGMSRESLLRSAVGVYVGCCSNEWAYVSQKMTDKLIGSYTATSTAASIISNRVSYVFGLVGPSMTVDTACSSSLIAVNLAGHDLRIGLASAALVGGVNLMLSAEVFVAFCKARMMAPDARCKTFDASANGYIRGEGFVGIVLKLMDRAVQCRDRILAVVKATSVNHGGRAAGLTAPNAPAQKAVVLSALRAAGLQPSDVNYIEAHGTGTALGDPIEVNALKSLFAAKRSCDNPLILGALKTNIGHLEGAAGLAGLLKALLCLRHGVVPPNLHFRHINPHIDTKDFALAIPTAGQLVELKPGLCYSKRVAGVSSFGFGGANAHVILEESDRCVIRPETSLAGVCAKLEDPTQNIHLAFMFAGPGCQTLNMGKHFYQDEPVFQAAVLEVQDLFKDVLPRPLCELLYPEEGADTSDNEVLLDQLLWMEACTFAVQYAMARLWMSRGVKPDAVMGEGVGEIVAAVCADILSVADAVKFIGLKAELIGADKGVMVNVRASLDDIEMAMAEVGPENAASVGVAAVYAERSLLLSGKRAAVELVLLSLGQVASARGKFIRCDCPLQSPMFNVSVGH